MNHGVYGLYAHNFSLVIRNCGAYTRAMVTIDPIIIANRRQEIAEEIKRLQTEDAELEIAVRVSHVYRPTETKPSKRSLKSFLMK